MSCCRYKTYLPLQPSLHFMACNTFLSTCGQFVVRRSHLLKRCLSHICDGWFYFVLQLTFPQSICLLLHGQAVQNEWGSLFLDSLTLVRIRWHIGCLQLSDPARFRFVCPCYEGKYSVLFFMHKTTSKTTRMWCVICVFANIKLLNTSQMCDGT
jgi:hypothetical protein